MIENIIEVKNVSMKFNLSKEKIDSLKEYFIKFMKNELHYTEFQALKNISFTVKKGESLAILGANGSGKSTLLKIISGVYKPSSGESKVNGTIAPLLELGTGFDSDLTARENIFLNGVLLGHTRKFMESKMDEIIEFSELSAFIDVPIKNFSSGMIARLGFSIATLIKPELLIVDEILSVGDMAFKQKCEKKMSELLEGETTLVLVSHNIGDIKKICSRAIWIKDGMIEASGDVEDVCSKYTEFMSKK